MPKKERCKSCGVNGGHKLHCAIFLAHSDRKLDEELAAIGERAEEETIEFPGVMVAEVHEHRPTIYERAIERFESANEGRVVH